MQDVWGRGPLSGAMLTSIVPVLVVWLGLQALLGLYPGYGLDEAKQLRRQVYALFSTLAITSVFAVASQTGRFGLAAAASRKLSRASGSSASGSASGKTRAYPGRGVGQAGYRARGPRKRGAPGKSSAPRASSRALSRLVSSTTVSRRGGENRKVLEGDTLEYAINLGREREMDTAIFATPHTRREHLAQLVGRASTSFRHVVVTPNLGGITNSAVVARDFSGHPGRGNQAQPPRPAGAAHQAWHGSHLHGSRRASGLSAAARDLTPHPVGVPGARFLPGCAAGPGWKAVFLREVQDHGK